MKNYFIYVTMLFLGVLSCSSKGAGDNGSEGGDPDSYKNPLLATSLPDPTIVRGDDGFYLYATEDIRNVPILFSSDLVKWSNKGTAFTNATRPSFEPKGGIWAPSINKIGAKYVMYYSMSVWGGEWTCGIGVASADSPTGPFTDHGMLFRSNVIGVQNSIDPSLLVLEDGSKHLVWGSFRGIYSIEMSEDGLSLKAGAEKNKVLGDGFEAVYIYKKGEYYYLFASIGSCCAGLNSTYTVVAGRSQNPLGEYVSRNNSPMTINNYHAVLTRNNNFVGPGHHSEIVTDNEGDEWVLYHGVDVRRPAGRVLLLDKVNWVDGWPLIGDGTPSISTKKPKF